MRIVKRIMTAGFVASVLLGTVGTLLPQSDLLTQTLLAWDHRDQDWDKHDQDSYRHGYDKGRDDARAHRRFDSNKRWDADFRRGYEDGYNRESRGKHYGWNDNRGWGSDRYDRSHERNDGYNNGNYNTGYSGPGSMTWRGRVDDYVELRVQGNRVRSIERGGAPTYNEQASFSSPLPRADVRVEVKKREGRGKVSLLEQPSRNNNYTAVIRIEDSKGGADDYQIEMQWR